jgi:hypothetical protein
MTNTGWFANSAQLQMTSGATIASVAAIRNIRFTPKTEVAELRGIESGFRLAAAKYNFEVDVSFEYAMWDATSDIVLYSFMKGANTTQSGAAQFDDSAGYRSQVATFNITATIYDHTRSNYFTATIYNVYFGEIPYELRENEWISRNMSGKGASMMLTYATT